MGAPVCRLIVYIVVTAVGCRASTYVGDDFHRHSYLRTAMRLSMPELDQEATEEEIMNDIRKLEDNELSSETDTDQTYQIRPEKRYMEFPGKRYMEFVGKRFMEFPGKRYFEFPGKRYSEFPGKRYDEFLGKRDMKSMPGYSNTDSDYRIKPQSKRYKEILGKRDALPAVENDLKVFKRWAEFLGKRSKPALYEDDVPYHSKSDSSGIQDQKRYTEFIG